MPFLNAKISVPRSSAMTAQVARTLLDLTTEILGKRRDLTAIVIDYVDPDQWFIAGKSLRELGVHSFYLNIKITDETNTKDQKARYLRATYAAFEALLGPLHAESYIVIDDVRATAWGYGGITQEARFQLST